MKPMSALVVAASLCMMISGCAGGRVRGGQGTEMQQEEEYRPEQKVKPPEGNVSRVSGPLTTPTPPPVLEVDLERRRRPPSPEIEPEPGPSAEPAPETER
jgi:hypothetical protein